MLQIFFFLAGVIERLLLNKEFLRVNFLNLPSDANSDYLRKLVTTELKFKKGDGPIDLHGVEILCCCVRINAV